MPLQIQVEAISVTPSGAGKSVTLRMRCWEDGATVPTDPTVIDTTQSTYIRAKADDLTPVELRQAALNDIVSKFQAVIDEYKECNPILTWVSNNGIAPIVAALEG